MFGAQSTTYGRTVKIDGGVSYWILQITVLSGHVENEKWRCSFCAGEYLPQLSTVGQS